MKSFVFFLIRIAILIGVVIFLVDRPGTARIVWHDYVIETSAAFFGIIILGVGFVLYLLFKFFYLIKQGLSQWRLKRAFKKFRKGQDRLTQGMVAVAAGDASEAGRLALAARKLMGSTTATQLLQAQAAQLAGDSRAAKDIFRVLAAAPESAMLGYRGLIAEARRIGDWIEVERLIDKLGTTHPDAPWLNLSRFELLSYRGNWKEATAALDRVASSRLMEPDKLRRTRAAVLVALSKDEAKLGEYDKALQAAERAVRQAPDWLPAIINLAERQMQGGHRRAARRTIEKNWPRMPHPELAAAWRSGDSDPLEAYKHIERLCRHDGESSAGFLAMAEAALAADLWGEARRWLLSLVSRGEVTQGVYKLLARLERREKGDEQAALRWLIKAVDAPPDPTWLCHSCGGSQNHWQAVCVHCGAFHTLDWASPGKSRVEKSSLGLRGCAVTEMVAHLASPSSE